MVVLADADVERAANAAVYYAMLNGGQTCVSVERVYVEAPVYDDFVAKVTEKARALRNDRSTGPGTADVGSMTFPPQVDIVERHVRDAVDKGARVRGRRRARPRRAGRLLVRADRAGRRRPHDGVHARGDLRPDAADHEGGRRRGGHPPGQRLALRPGRRRSSPRTSRAARRSRAASRRAPCASTTRTSTTPRSSCRWAARRPAGMGSRHGAGGIRKYTQQQALLISRAAPEARPAHVPVQREDDGRPGQARPRPLRARQARLARYGGGVGRVPRRRATPARRGAGSASRRRSCARAARRRRPARARRRGRSAAARPPARRSAPPPPARARSRRGRRPRRRRGGSGIVKGGGAGRCQRTSASSRRSATSRRTTSRLGIRRSKAKRSSFSASSSGRRTKRAAVSSSRRLRCLAMRATIAQGYPDIQVLELGRSSALYVAVI